MIDFEKELEEILANDPLGLLAYKPKVSATITADERLIASFQEINAFLDAHGCEPAESREIGERRLFSRLKGLRADPAKAAALLEYDQHGLLTDVKPPTTGLEQIHSIEDVLSNDVLGLLDRSSEEAIAADIFTLKHVSKSPKMPDHVAKRKPCKEFETFEPLFKQARSELKSGLKKMVPFKSERQIRADQIFVLHGMMVFVAGRGEWERRNFGNFNARLYCVFDNGTESNMLLRSLAAALWKDESSRQVVPHDQAELFEEENQVGESDKPSGYIYVLRSLSEDPKIQEIDNLYKIGFSATEVDARIAGAAGEPTYLMAGVAKVADFATYNLNPQKLEGLLHRLFAKACLNLDVFDDSGKRYSPREWFIVPIHVIETAVQLLISGEIVKYRYDHEAEQIVPKD